MSKRINASEKTPRSSRAIHIVFAIGLFLVLYQDIFSLPTWIRIHQELILVPFFALDALEIVALLLVWNRVFVKRHYKDALYLLIPVVFNGIYAVAALHNHHIDGYATYIAIATYLITISHFRLDLFYMDYSGFVSYYIELFDTLITILIFSLLHINRRKL